MQRVKSRPGVPAAAVRSVLLIFVPFLSCPPHSLDICAHTSFNSLYAPVKVPLEQQQQQQCSYSCLCSFCRHTRIHIQQTPSACLYVCMRIMRSSTSAQQQLSLCLSFSTLARSLSHSLSFVSAILATFLHVISFCAKGVARPLLLLFCIHTYTHTRAHWHSNAHDAQWQQHNVHDYFAALFLFVMFLFLQTPNYFFSSPLRILFL